MIGKLEDADALSRLAEKENDTAVEGLGEYFERESRRYSRRLCEEEEAKSR